MDDLAIAKIKGWMSECDFTDGDKDKHLFDALCEMDEVYSEHVGSHRWWDDVWTVVSCDGMLIGYMSASANRDESIMDLGWSLDPRTICRVKPVEKIVTAYEKIK